MHKHNHSIRAIVSASFVGSYALLSVFVIVKGDATKYLHPRFIPFLIASNVLCVFIIPAMLRKGVHDHRKLSAWKIIAAALPLVFGFFVTPAPAAFGGEYSAERKAPASIQSTDDLSEPARKARASDSVKIDGSNMYLVIQDIYGSPELYKDKKIEITGLAVRKKNSTDTHSFAVIRMMMTCCAADLQPVGIVCTAKENVVQVNQKWHTVFGKITVTTENGEAIPSISVERIEPAEKPAQEYIYPI